MGIGSTASQFGQEYRPREGLETVGWQYLEQASARFLSFLLRNILVISNWTSSLRRMALYIVMCICMNVNQFLFPLHCMNSN
jgi:hypothetical protein